MEDLCHQQSRANIADPSHLLERSDLAGAGDRIRAAGRCPLRFELLELPAYKFEAFELSGDLATKKWAKCAAITGLKALEPFAPLATPVTRHGKLPP